MLFKSDKPSIIIIIINPLSCVPPQCEQPVEAVPSKHHVLD